MLPLGVLAALVALGASAASCSQTPVNVPVRTFERAQKSAVVCMHVKGDLANNPFSGLDVPPEPTTESQCAPVAADTDGTPLPYHLYALVTQTTRGELAVVDLTQGVVVDTDRSTPGTNFLPVGQIPTDVAVTPDGQLSFVAAAEVNKPAIYAIDNKLLLGDSQTTLALDAGAPTIPKLTTWPVCALPQNPGSLVVLPRALAPSAATAVDGGVAEAGAGEGGADDAGSGAAVVGAPATSYPIAVVFPGDATHAAGIATFDSAPFQRGTASGASGPGIFAAGALDDCSGAKLDALTFAGAAAAGAAVPVGPAWDPGLHYDAGAPVAPPLPASSSPACPVDGGSDAGSSASSAGPDAGAVAALPPTAPRGGAMAVDDNGTRITLYVADEAAPLVHVIDATDPRALRELAPLRALSADDPARKVTVGQIAVSPTTRDYQRFLYAIDQRQGSVMVFDITDPLTSPKQPLTRPHPELNPFQPSDRILFGVPAATLTFARHDFLLQKIHNADGTTTPLTPPQGGLLCNPNPVANVNPATGGDQGPFSPGANGAYYRPDVTNQDITLGPLRLRGIFALVTLSNGNVVTVDVDDWDGPCRRPLIMADLPAGDPDGLVGAGITSDIAPPQPLDATFASPDPYGVPDALGRDLPKPLTLASWSALPVSNEAFYPVSAPHRARSLNYLRNDPSTGVHLPTVAALPQLFVKTTPLASDFTNGRGNPLLVQTVTTLADPTFVKDSTLLTASWADPLAPATVGVAPQKLTSLSFPVASTHPGVRFAYEDPLVHVDQDWAVTYEGSLPGFEQALVGTVATVPGVVAYQQVQLAAAGALLCGRGVEDFAVGTERAGIEGAAMIAAGLTPPANMDRWTTDYAQLTDDLLADTDPYFSVQGDTCWDGVVDDHNNKITDGPTRQHVCAAAFGNTLDPTNETPTRDFPIVEAHDDRLVLGRYGYTGAAPRTDNREVVVNDPSNVNTLRLMQCCFHKQVHFRVRTGGEWVATGSSSGYLHHVVAGPPNPLDPASDLRCVNSCDPRLALLNSRAPGLPRVLSTNGPDAQYQKAEALLGLGRNSVLALRNPMFSIAVWNGGDGSSTTLQPVLPSRDMVWRFSSRGQFSPVSVNTAAGTTEVDPQSMRFIDSLGQVAVVDGSSQGLILIDLDTVSIARAPYF